MGFLAAIVAAPVGLYLVGGGMSGIDSALAAAKLGSAPGDGGVSAPEITGVLPSSGPATANVSVTLQGRNFATEASSLKVSYGPQGVGASCNPAPISDTLLTCVLPHTMTAGVAQHFVVTSGTGAGTKSSPVSSATYLPLNPAAVTSQSARSVDPPFDVQVHLLGRDFGSVGGLAPLVTYKSGATTQACSNVQLISPTEVVCTLPSTVYRLDAGADQFTVVRAGE